MSSLIDDVEAFLVQQNMAPTAFGEQALNDRHFVRQLRNGRRAWPETEEKVRTFMREHAAAAGGGGVGDHGSPSAMTDTAEAA